MRHTNSGRLVGKNSGGVCNTPTMATGVREMPAYLEMGGNIKTDWQCYFGYAFVLVFFAAHMFSCAFLPQFEEMISEARRNVTYVRNVNPTAGAK